LGYLLQQCDEHIEFTVKISTLSFGSLFGGGSGSEVPQKGVEEKREDGTYVDGYKVADEEDIRWLASIL
jgi:hypothetical protein